MKPVRIHYVSGSVYWQDDKGENHFVKEPSEAQLVLFRDYQRLLRRFVKLKASRCDAVEKPPTT